MSISYEVNFEDRLTPHFFPPMAKELRHAIRYELKQHMAQEKRSALMKKRISRVRLHLHLVNERKHRISMDDVISIESVITLAPHPLRPMEAYLLIQEKSELEWIEHLPPLNHITMSELDPEDLFRNMQLRHDMLFDETIGFKINKDAETYKEKLRALRLYFNLFEEELKGGISFRLVFLMHEIQLLTKTTLLDLELMAHQLEHNVFDFDHLKHLLGSLLRECADPAQLLLLEEACNRNELAVALYFAFLMLEEKRMSDANAFLKSMRPIVLQEQAALEQQQYLTRPTSRTGAWIASLRAKHPSSLQDAVFDSILDMAHHGTDLYSIPESLRFDLDRIEIIGQEWKECALILSILSLTHMNKISHEQRQDIKKTVAALLNDKETSLEHVAVFMANQLSVDFDKMKGMLEKVIQPENPVMQLYVKRIRSYLKSAMIEKNAHVEAFGLGDIAPAIAPLAIQLKRLGQFHWSVYSEIYKSLV